jgi:hypothetical protein
MCRPFALGRSRNTIRHNVDTHDSGGDLQVPLLRQGNTAGQFVTIWSRFVTLNKVSLNQRKDKLGRINSLAQTTRRAGIV